MAMGAVAVTVTVGGSDVICMFRAWMTMYSGSGLWSEVMRSIPY